MAKAKIPAVTKEELAQINEHNLEMMHNYLDDIRPDKSDKTLKQYESALKIFFRWVMQNANNKPLYEMKKRDALRYQNYLRNFGLGTNATKFKRSVVSSLCEYVETYFEEEKEYKSFRNIFKGVQKIGSSPIHEKNYILEDDWKRIIDILTEKEEWQILAYLQLSYSTGARKGEIIQLRKEIVDQPKAKLYKTHSVRGKGGGKEGKFIEFLRFNNAAMDAVKKWLEVRGEDECEYIFVNKVKRTGEVSQLDPDTFNTWMKTKIQPLVDYRVYPHILRKTCATHMLNAGVPIELIQKQLNHNSSETTKNHYIVSNDDDKMDDIFDLLEKEEDEDDEKE